MVVEAYVPCCCYRDVEAVMSQHGAVGSPGESTTEVSVDLSGQGVLDQAVAPVASC